MYWSQIIPIFNHFCEDITMCWKLWCPTSVVPWPLQTKDFQLWQMSRIIRWLKCPSHTIDRKEAKTSDPRITNGAAIGEKHKTVEAISSAEQPSEWIKNVQCLKWQFRMNGEAGRSCPMHWGNSAPSCTWQMTTVMSICLHYQRNKAEWNESDHTCAGLDLGHRAAPVFTSSPMIPAFF